MRTARCDVARREDVERVHKEATGWLGTVDLLIKELKPSNYATAVALAELPEQIRGYGPVKERALAKVREQEKQLRNRLTGGEIKVLNLFDPAA